MTTCPFTSPVRCRKLQITAINKNRENFIYTDIMHFLLGFFIRRGRGFCGLVRNKLSLKQRKQKQKLHTQYKCQSRCMNCKFSKILIHIQINSNTKVKKHDYDEETNHNTVKQIKKFIYKSNKQFSNVTMYLGLAIKSHSLLRPLFVCPEGSLISLFRTSSLCLPMVLL